MRPKKTTTRTRKTNYRTKTNRTSKTNRTTTTTNKWACNSPKFNTPRQECEWRMGSYKNVYTQFKGAGQKTQLSPTIAKKWVKYVNNGNPVYKFTNKDFCNYFGQKFANSTPRAARQYLTQKFGRTIKDVTRGKGNCWLVATTKTPTATPFKNYNW